MALKANYNSRDEIPEGMTDHYKETDNGFILDVESDAGYVLENVDGLKSALQSERSNAKLLNEKVNTLSSTLESMKSKQTKTPVVDDRSAQLEAKLGEMESILNEKNSKIQNMLMENTLGRALNKVDLIDNGSMLLMPHIKSQLTVVDGSVKVVDSNGQVRISSKGGNVQDMTVSDLLNEMKDSDVYSNLFKAKTITGSGGRTSMGNSGTSKKFSEMTLDERSMLYQKNPALYDSLKGGN